MNYVQNEDVFLSGQHVLHSEAWTYLPEVGRQTDQLKPPGQMPSKLHEITWYLCHFEY